MNKLLMFLGRLERDMKKNSPTLLTAASIGGVLLTGITAFEAGRKAEIPLSNYKYRLEQGRDTKKEVLKDTAKEMAPIVAKPAIVGGLTAFSMLKANSISSRRIAALSAAYAVSETTIKNLNNKMEEVLGEKKARKIRDEILKDRLVEDDQNGRSKIDSLPMPGEGDVLCKDSYTGQLFYSSIPKIEMAIARCTNRIATEMYISLNEFFLEINSPTLETTKMGDDLGWNTDDLCNNQLPVIVRAMVYHDRPCVVMDYDVNVRRDFRNLH